MRTYTPSELYHLQQNVSYGVDPELLGRSTISLADPSLFDPWRKHGQGGTSLVDPSLLDPWRKHGQGGTSGNGGGDTSGNGGGDTSGNGDEYEDEGWWAGLAPWIKVTGVVVGVSGLTFGAYKLSGR